MASNEEFWAKLDAIGAEQVRANFASNVYLGAERSLAAAWIERRKEASSSEQLAIARAAKDAALAAALQAATANKLAKIAILIATVAVVVGIFGIFH